MSVSLRHVTAHGPMLGTIGRVAVDAVQRRLRPRPHPRPAAPGPEVRLRVSPPPAALVRDYIRTMGGDPAWYRGRIPPHLFPQWGLAAASRALGQVSIPVEEVLNAGCRIEAHRPLPAGADLQVRARVQRYDEDERRALIEVRIVTGTEREPDAVVGTVVGVVPRQRRAGGKAAKEPVRVPPDAREIGFWRLSPRAGMDFAVLTGDFNPLHWLAPYARAFGYRGPVLHGFATMARAWEGLVRARLSGDANLVRSMDVRFTRALVLPATVGLYLGSGGAISVGDAPSGPAYLAGTVVLDEPTCR